MAGTAARAAKAQPRSRGFNPQTPTATFDNETLSLDIGGCTLCVRYADCEEAEDAGGLIYVWPRDGGPIVVPTRVLADADEAARLVSRLAGHIGVVRRVGLAG